MSRAEREIALLERQLEEAEDEEERRALQRELRDIDRERDEECDYG